MASVVHRTSRRTCESKSSAGCVILAHELLLSIPQKVYETRQQEVNNESLSPLSLLGPLVSCFLFLSLTPKAPNIAKKGAHVQRAY